LLLVVLQLRYGVKKRKMREGQEKVNDEQ